MLLECLNDMTEQMADMETENLNLKIWQMLKGIYIYSGGTTFLLMVVKESQAIILYIRFELYPN